VKVSSSPSSTSRSIASGTRFALLLRAEFAGSGLASTTSVCSLPKASKIRILGDLRGLWGGEIGVRSSGVDGLAPRVSLPTKLVAISLSEEFMTSCVGCSGTSFAVKSSDLEACGSKRTFKILFLVAGVAAHAPGAAGVLKGRDAFEIDATGVARPPFVSTGTEDSTMEGLSN